MNIETGEDFAYLRQQWRRTGLYCSNQLFPRDDFFVRIKRNGHAMQVELENEKQTSLVDVRRTPSQFERPQPLPAMDDPAVYVLHLDIMQVNTRKNLHL